MTWIIVGLGNPEEKYDGTRHNTGRMVVKQFAKEKKLDEWKLDKKANALITRGIIERAATVLILPETFMNKSGDSVRRFVKSKKSAKEGLVVFHDELDLPLGTVRFAFNKGPGGHRGIESVIKAVGTQEFLRVRIGISPSDSKGRAKKPIGEEKVLKHILTKFKPEELKVLKKLSALVDEALICMIKESREKAMSIYNAKT